jgi:enoyl-CoA hydratase/carnithine racemase
MAPMRKEPESGHPSREPFSARLCGQVRPAALEEISLDRENKALVITGTGDSFIDQIDGPSLGEIFRPATWEKTRVEGAKVLQRLLELPIPVVGVANGPATVHSEYLLVADIHIASERASYGDFPHPAFGLTGGDRPPTSPNKTGPPDKPVR